MHQFLREDRTIVSVPGDNSDSASWARSIAENGTPLQKGADRAGLKISPMGRLPFFPFKIRNPGATSCEPHALHEVSSCNPHAPQTLMHPLASHAE